MVSHSRRLFLEVTAASAATAILGTSQNARADDTQTRTRNRLRSLVIFFQGGAQSPYEFVSPLVNSPTELRGNVTVIEGSNGAPIDSRWKEFAKINDQAAVIRSIDAKNSVHNGTFVIGNPADHAEKLASGGLPHPFIEAPSNFSDRSGLDASAGMHIRWDNASKGFRPPDIQTNAGLADRIALLHQLEHPMEGSRVERMKKNRDLAGSLLTGGGTMLQEPFDNAYGDYERYGNHPIGDACALASQFARSGAGVTLVYNEFGQGWDMHDRVQSRSDELIPPTDRALAELIRDAHRHDFVVLLTTEHGRTPIINGSGGRDHWPVGHAVLAGSAVKKGAVVGRLDRQGEIATEKITGPKLMKTVLQACGDEQPNRAELVAEVII